ncbi:MAG TPA: hypothetical protein VFH71_10130, partial [Rhodanobacteraceae bacterium]|nr:hypothetical protein [Rhodanobacteraceae bacterium]
MIARSEDLSPESFDFLSIEQTTVGAALTQLNTNVDNTANVAVKYDAAGGGKITLGATGGAGALAGGVTITNLKAGTIAPGSTDAVNGSQLYAVQQTAGEGWNVTTAATGSGVANGTSVANVAPGATATFT